MEKDDKLKKEVIALVKKAQASYHISTEAMQEDKCQLKKMYDDLSASYDNLSKEMLEDVETLEKVLQQSAGQVGDHSESDKVLESLQTCFDSSSQQWIEVTMKAKCRLLNEAQQISNDYLKIKHGEMLKIRKLFADFMLITRSKERESGSTSIVGPKLEDTFWGIVTAVDDPAKFYIVRCCDIQERQHFFDQIQSTASTFPHNDAVVSGQMYAVCRLINKDQMKWFRAIVGVPCGIYQVGDNPKETLYQCFLVDIGRHEQIPKSSIRTLPHDLKMRPSYAIQCTLNGISKWSLESTASFKDWIAFSSRIHIKVLAKEEDHLHVDLFRPEKGDRMVSVMDSVMKAQRPTQQPVTLEKAAQIKTFKPKFGELESKSKLPKHSSVFVTKATTPKDIFIQFQDEDYQLYCKMQERLQREFSTAQSATLCSSPLIGHAYAAQLGTKWYRVFIEKTGRTTEAFYVDIGHRQPIHPTMVFHNLPNSFMEIPTQAVCCVLHSVHPPNKGFQNYPKKIQDFMRCYEGKPAVAIFKNWSDGESEALGAISNPSLKYRAYVILYPTDENSCSINIKVSETPMAILLSEKCMIEPPEHFNIRKRLAALSKIGPSIVPIEVPPSVGDSDKRQVVKAVFPTPDLEVEGVPVPVIYIECRTPDSIFFRTPELEKELSNLQKILLNHFKGYKKAVERYHLKVGFVCAVKHNENWFRAKVTDLDMYPEIGVILIDTGNFLKVSASGIRYLPEEMRRPPKLVLECVLSGVYPPSGSVWHPKVTEHIIDRFQEAARITIEHRKDQLKASSGTGNALHVVVFIYEDSSSTINKVSGSTAKKPSLNQELVRLGLATEVANIFDKVPRPINIGWKSRETLSVGATFFATVTHFNEKGEIFLQDLRFKPELDTIRSQLNEKYESSFPSDTDLHCAPGDLCIAKNRSKSFWFRGVVQEVKEKKATVYSVDFGTLEIVDVTDIRLSVILTEKPIHILRCSLFNLKPVDGAQEWSPEVQSAIFGKALKCDYRVKIKAKGPPLQVAMVYKNFPGTFNRELVDIKLAEFVDVTLTRSARRQEENGKQRSKFRNRNQVNKK